LHFAGVLSSVESVHHSTNILKGNQASKDSKETGEERKDDPEE
jgi:hypothetical protein